MSNYCKIFHQMFGVVHAMWVFPVSVCRGGGMHPYISLKEDLHSGERGILYIVEGYRHN